MPRPNEYRDYPLGIFMALVAVTGLFWTVAAGRSDTVEISLAGRCSGDHACLTASTLAALPSVTEVRHEAVDATHTIFLKAGPDVSAQSIWDASASSDHQPARLVFGRREFSTRPIR